MTANLPIVDPLKVHSPVLIVCGEYDGIATEVDLINFYKQLPYADRQFVILPGRRTPFRWESTASSSGMSCERS